MLLTPKRICFFKCQFKTKLEINIKNKSKEKKTQRKKWQIGHKMQTKPKHFLFLNLKKYVYLEYLILQHNPD